MTFNRKKPPAAGRGRPKGALNKTTKALKEMALSALEQAGDEIARKGSCKQGGGEAYFLKVARDNPPVFMAFLGKILPTELNANLNSSESLFALVTASMKPIDKAKI